MEQNTGKGLFIGLGGAFGVGTVKHQPGQQAGLAICDVKQD